MRIFYTSLFFLSTLSIWSQTFTVSGSIVDQANYPIAYSNILLLRAQDSTIVTGTTSNDDGKFTFLDVAPNTYILKASFISYRDNYFNLTVDRNIEIPTLVLEESIEALSEIQLVYRKPTLKREVDRLVFNVEKTALSEGNLMEVLRSTPSVIVMDDAITVKGSQPTVYINDRKVHISSSEIVELLQGTSASNIKSIEVITNPPARYDAESGVVLNIVMSKNLVSGYNGSLFSNFTQGVFPKANHGINNYFKGKSISLFANYSYSNRKDDRVDNEAISFPTNKWNSNVDKNSWSETHNLNLNFDWDLNKNNTISLSTNTQFLPYYKRLTRSKTNIIPTSDLETGSFNSVNVSRDIKNNLGFDFDFVHRFNNEARLTTRTHYTTYDYERKQNVSTNYFFGDNSFESSNAFNTKTNQDTKIIASQIDYSLPLSEASNFEIGVKFSNVKIENNNIHNDIIGGVKVLNNDNTNAFDYIQDIYAAYASFSNTYDKWSLSLGLRAEQTKIEGVSSPTNQTNTQDYLEWFPTVSVGYEVSDKVNTYINFKRSLERPDYSYLNPFKFYLNDNTFVTGNPDLKPIFTDHYLIGISINNMFTIESYYKKYKNNIFELPFQDNINNSLAYTSININYTEEIGLDFEAYFNISESWTVYIGNSFYNYKDNATLFGSTFNKDKWSNYSIWQNNFSFLKDNSLTASFNLDYSTKTVQGLQVIEPRLMSQLSLLKTIFKGKGNVSLIISDLFNKEDWSWTTKFGNQDNKIRYNLDYRYIKLGFRYKFGNTKLSTNERASSIEERGRLGNKH